MAETAILKVSYLKKAFFFTHLTGLAAGLLFPLVAGIVIGSPARSWSFVVLSLIMGFGIGAIMFFFVLLTLKGQVRRQLDILRPLTGDTRPTETVEGLQNAMESSIQQVEALIHGLLTTIEQLLPHHKSLADSSRYLFDRTKDGLAAAQNTRTDVEAMAGKQEEVINQVQILSDRAQDEAALSRELSASLEEMAGAMDHSTAKFLETSSSVDEMTSSVKEVAQQADEISHSVEGTARDLDGIGESLERIRTGSYASARGTEAVQKDAQAGLQVVRSSMEEMERIEQESQRAMTAMQRLSRQTAEVGKIIEVIKELVSDTELLAFNAAIIAAKAGEEGKGFSVVAEEIRDLADRTTASAQEIHRIVRAIGGDTREVTEAVEATGMRIAKGKQLSLSTGEALRKIVDSSGQAARASEEIATLTEKEEARARALLDDAGRSLRSVRAIARAMREQQTAITRIQEGVNQMKAAADQIARGMEEQVRANREFDKSLAEREAQIQAITGATSFQMEIVQRVFKHFEQSESRLKRNADKTASLAKEGVEMENLTHRLRELITAAERKGPAAAA